MPATTPSGSRRSIEVWSSMYSPAACASIVRAAPAKNRRLSIVRSNSKSIIETGFPTFSPSMAFNSSRFSSSRSASASNASDRVRGVAVPHSANAAFAAFTAASTSAASLDGTEAMTAPVAGASTSSVTPLWAGTHFPPMKLRCATTTPFLSPRIVGHERRNRKESTEIGP